MSFVPKTYQDAKLQSYQDGTMPQGLKLGCEFDRYFVWKQGQYNNMLGIDNVGKTLFKSWYYTCLAKLHDLKFDIYSSENQIWSWKMKIMSFYLGKNVQQANPEEYLEAKLWQQEHFDFVDDTKDYTAFDLLDLFKTTEAHGCLIDPLNALDEPDGIDSYRYNKKVLRAFRQFPKQKHNGIYKTLEVVGHCNTEASRRFHKSGDFKNMIMPPEKSHWDGGQIFPNRCDDFLVLHRYFMHDWKDICLVFVDKIKETETGGSRTLGKVPLQFQFVPWAFMIDGLDPLNPNRIPTKEIIDPQGGMGKNFPEGEPEQETEAPF